MRGLSGEIGVREAEAGDLVAAQVAEHRVGVGHQQVERRAVAVACEVERHRPLPAVEDLEEDRVLAGLERRDVAADVAVGPGILDLDDLGAEVGELERGPGACAELLDGEDPDAIERQPPAHVTSRRIGPFSAAPSGRGGPVRDPQELHVHLGDELAVALGLLANADPLLVGEQLDPRGVLVRGVAPRERVLEMRGLGLVVAVGQHGDVVPCEDLQRVVAEAVHDRVELARRRGVRPPLEERPLSR